MPAPGTQDPETTTGRIRAWLEATPGNHRARDVADGIGKPPDLDVPDHEWRRRVANSLAKEARAGRVTRMTINVSSSHRKTTTLYTHRDA